MKILIACEESQEVTKAFRENGHKAFSCDILPCSGEHPEWHLQQDVTELLKQKWDMIIAFPPCTYLTVTGNSWYNVKKYGKKAIRRKKKRELAVNFFKMFMECDCDKVAIENPVGIMSKWRKPNQIIHPYYFGDPFEKKTCLWLKGLPKLKPANISNIKKPPKRTVFKSGTSMPTWYADAWKLPKEERARLRSKTFEGVARAMADQWGLLTEESIRTGKVFYYKQPKQIELF